MDMLKLNDRLGAETPLNIKRKEAGGNVKEPPSAVIISLLVMTVLSSVSWQEAVSAATDEERLVKIHNVIQQLPPPHYRSGSQLTAVLFWLKSEI